MTDDVDRLVRRARRDARFPLDASCSGCAERNTRLLVPDKEPILCLDCLATARGRSAVEMHHFAGRKNSNLTVPLTRNQHGIVSDLAYAWPQKTRDNPSGS